MIVRLLWFLFKLQFLLIALYMGLDGLENWRHRPWWETVICFVIFAISFRILGGKVIAVVFASGQILRGFYRWFFHTNYTRYY